MASRTPLLDEFTDTLRVGIPARTGGQPVSDFGGMGQAAPQLDFSPLESLRQQLMQSIGQRALGLLPSRAQVAQTHPGNVAGLTETPMPPSLTGMQRPPQQLGQLTDMFGQGTFGRFF